MTQAKTKMSNPELVLLSDREEDPSSIAGRKRDIILVGFWGGGSRGTNKPFLDHPLCGTAGGPAFKENYIRT